MGTPSFIAAGLISRAPSSLTLRFDITSAIHGRGEERQIGQDTRASHVRVCQTTGGSISLVGRNRISHQLVSRFPSEAAA